MLSKTKIKYIHSLGLKKNRETEKVFIAEGIKLIDEIIHSDFIVHQLYCTDEVYEYFLRKAKKQTQVIEISQSELKKISQLATPQKALAIVQQYDNRFDYDKISGKLHFFLDDVNDPGNLGTIVRIAAWFGIDSIFCSNECVDIYNFKAVQASMGAIVAKNVFYVDKMDFFKKIAQMNSLTVYGTYLEGDNIYNQALTPEGIIVLGSEAHGISHSIEKFITQKLFIPSFAQKHKGAESLNVGVAAAIVCSEFMRKLFFK